MGYNYLFCLQFIIQKTITVYLLDLTKHDEITSFLE